MISRSALRELTYTAATLGANPWLKESLRHDIQAQPQLLRRVVGLIALRANDYGANKLYRQAVTRSYRRAGETVIGLGYHSVVLQDGPSAVKKVHHRTLAIDQAAQQQAAQRLTDRQTPILDAFPDLAVEQRFRVQPFPPATHRSCVTANQPLIEQAIPADSLRPSDRYTNFLEEARMLYDRTGHMPDIVGLENIFETAGGLKIVDTIPLSANNPEDHNALQLAFSILALHGMAKGLQARA